MPIMRNRSNQLLIVPKNSGPSIYLAPGEAAVVAGFEIDGNGKIEKLAKSGALALEEEAKPIGEESKAGSRKPKSEKQ